MTTIQRYAELGLDSNEADAKGNDPDERETSEARRKALRQVVPMAVGAISKVPVVLSPLSMVGKAAGQLDFMNQQQVAPLTSYLRMKLPELKYLNVASEGAGRYSFTVTRESALSAIVSQYLRLSHREDSAFVFPFHVYPPSQETLESYDCELALAPGSVFGKLIKQKPEPTVIVTLQSKTISANLASEIWLFVTSGLKKSEEDDFLMDSVFATEKKFLPGRIMVIGLNTVFAEVFGNEVYTIQSVASETWTDQQGAPAQVFKTMLIENASIVQPRDKREGTTKNLEV